MVEYPQPPRVGTGRCRSKRQTGRLLQLRRRNFFPPPAEAEGGDDMVTYGDMFAYTLVLISVVGLCVQIAQFRNKKK